MYACVWQAWYKHREACLLEHGVSQLQYGHGNLKQLMQKMYSHGPCTCVSMQPVPSWQPQRHCKQELRQKTQPAQHHTNSHNTHVRMSSFEEHSHTSDRHSTGKKTNDGDSYRDASACQNLFKVGKSRLIDEYRDVSLDLRTSERENERESRQQVHWEYKTTKQYGC